MIWTREEMHHSTSNVPSCPAHLGLYSRTLSWGAYIRKGEWVRISLSTSVCLLHRKLQSSRLSALGAAVTCKPGGNNHLLPRRTERVSLKLNAPLSGTGPADLSGRRRIHWSCGRVWRQAWRSEAAAPGLAELRQTTEVTCCESGRVC